MTDTAPRPTVRVRPIYLVNELRNRTTCDSCGLRPPTQDAFVVHIDRTMNERDELKSQAFLACSQECCDLLHRGLTVEYSMVGVKHTKKGVVDGGAE